MNIIFRLLYHAYRAASSANHWTRRRLTLAGQVVLVAASVGALLGLDVENTVGYQAVTLLLALLLVALLAGFRFRAPFAVERSLPRLGTVGEPVHYRVELRNLSAKNQVGLTLLEDLADPRPPFREWKEFKLDEDKHVRAFRAFRQRTNPFTKATVSEGSVPSVAPQQRVEVPMQLTPRRRGLAQFTGVTLARPDPLGLFRALHRISAPHSVLILPRRYPLPPLALPGAMKYQPGGVALASNIGQSDEFVALRDYRAGDPVRHIHWRSWAKTGAPIVKEFEDEFFVRHALVLDTFTLRPHSEVFEEAVSVAASFACTVLTQESLLDLLFVGPQAYCFTAGRGLAHADQMLEILAAVRPCPEPSFGTLEHLVINHASALSGCICVLLAWDDERQRLVEKIKLLGLPVLVVVLRPRGETSPLAPGPMRDTPDRLHALEVGRIEEQLARLR